MTWKEQLELNRRDCHLTFNGGHHDKETNEAFHQGMDTVFNLLEGERSVFVRIIEKLINDAADISFEAAESSLVATEVKQQLRKKWL